MIRLIHKKLQSIFHSNRALILMYHRVFDTVNDPLFLCTSPKNFESHLKIISQYYNPISLSDLSEAIKNKSVPEKAICLTFDDGYLDNLLVAKPLLEKYRIPATIFVSTDFIGKNREFWWDELERIILLAPVLPKNLHLLINKKEYRWDLTNQKNHACHLHGWNIAMDAPNDRFALYKDLHTLFFNLSHAQREETLTHLASWAGVSRASRPYYRAVNKKELLELSECPFIEIGSHTVTHSQLSSQSKSEQKSEILTSKNFLESILKKPVASFSYPFGGTHNINRKTCYLVKKNKYKLAVTTIAKPATKRANLFLLPRFSAGNCIKELFQANLNRWFEI